ncbi:MAG: cardiolipin synthase [Ginsengibacter sp.]
MSLIYISLSVYFIILILVCLRIIFETYSSSKALAYLFFCIFVPVIGILFYMAFGINYWQKKLYTKKSGENDKMLEELKNNISQYKESIVEVKDRGINDDSELAAMLLKDLQSPLTRHNSVKLLLNGEEKFPELMKCLSEAEHHIHLEYYIYEEDEIGSAIIELLIKKAKEGIEVRFIYDDFGSPTIKKKLEKRMCESGIEIFPFSKVHFYLLANRINYRNHRKIVIIDGKTGFTGGINVSDKYINNKPKQLYWRDTHLRIDGPGVYYLQYIFITDWNFCRGKKIKGESIYFNHNANTKEDVHIQIAGSGPDSVQPSILFSVLEAIYLAKKEILITTPYFIPGDAVVDALRIAALGGLSVKLLVPGKCDSKLVNAASKAHYKDLLIAGVEIYVYNKGFVHAKTLVTDGSLTMIGTANMDNRSFELNFEVNAIIYDVPFAEKMRKVFFEDLQFTEKLNAEKWYKRSFLTQLPEKLARLLSPSL